MGIILFCGVMFVCLCKMWWIFRIVCGVFCILWFEMIIFLLVVFVRCVLM